MKARFLALLLCAVSVVAAVSVKPAAAGPSPSPTASPSPTPNPYRSLDFAGATLHDESGSHIDVIGGFAAAKRDGKAAIVCVSFKNTSSLVARRAVFDFSLMGPRGRELGALQLDRRGEFSPGVEINGWSTLGAWQGGVGHRGYGDNCTTLQHGMASMPILQAAAFVHRVARVEFSNGTTWP